MDNNDQQEPVVQGDEEPAEDIKPEDVAAAERTKKINHAVLQATASERHKFEAPDEITSMERASRLCDETTSFLFVQMKRASEPSVEGEFEHQRIDVQLLITILWRVRQTAVIALSSTTDEKQQRIITEAIAAFDEALPDLKKMRDVNQHFDDYAVHSKQRRHKAFDGDEKINHEMLGYLRWGEDYFEWIGVGSFEFDTAREASISLNETLRKSYETLMAEHAKSLGIEIDGTEPL